MPKKSPRQLIIKANDDIFRTLIHARDKETCQKTGRTGVALDVAHFWRRNLLRTRWDLDNACLLQKGTHLFWAHSHFQDFQAFWLKRLGKERYDKLELKARYAAPVKMQDLLAMNYYLKTQLKKLAP